MDQYYLVWPMSDEPSRPDPDWLRTAKAKSPSCGHLVGRESAMRVVVGTLGANVPYNFVSPPQVEYLSDALHKALLPECERLLSFGVLEQREQGVVRGVHTFRAKNVAWMRGGPKSYCWRCDDCEEVWYDPVGKWYVLEQEIKSLAICGSHYGGLIVNCKVHERLTGQKWNKVKIVPLQIVQEPRDGLPVDLNMITKANERRRN